MVSINFDFGIDISIQQSQLNALFNNLLKEQIHNISNTEFDGFDVVLYQLDTSHLQIRGHDIFISLPLGVDLEKNLPIKDAHLKAEIEIVLQVSLQDGPLLPISTETNIIHYEWMKDPILKFAGISMNVERLSDFLIKRMKEELCDKLDAELSKLTNEESVIFSRFTQLAHGIAIPNKSLFQNLVISDISISDFITNGDQIKTQLGLKGKTGFYFDTLDLSTINHVPQLNLVDSVDSADTWELKTNIEDSDITNLISDFLLNLKIPANGKNIKIEEVQHTIQNDEYHLSVSLAGDFKARIDIVLEPMLDHSHQIISLDIKRIDLIESSFMFKALFPLIKGTIKAQIERNARISSRELQALLNKQLSFLLKGVLNNPYLSYDISLFELNFIELALNNHGLQFEMNAKSSCQINVA